MLQPSKETQLKKKLIKYAVIAAIATIVLTGAGFGISNYNDSVLSEQSLKQNQNNTIAAESREIETNLGIENEVAKYYDDYTKTHNKSFIINRDTVADLLTSLRKTNHLSSHIEVTISPVSELPEATLPVKSGKAVRSNVHITFGALTDNSVYNFISDLQHKLPGIVLISELKINKSGELSKTSVTLAMNQHTLIPMITGELTFVWIGINPPENNGLK